ncbi:MULTISPECIES: amidohydrolase family protein [Acidobacteriaceae]|uniref:amidohydrolase family protein n=1 Tax=Acidobacteriaceae TaxID=204434 RepID=UPI00131B74CF|nr:MULTISPECIES: amidohydrolase family protein [Acidobacteriaceae]MDW5265160.1 amidohydrolase family protein [Edaphobacter sp.]
MSGYVATSDERHDEQVVVQGVRYAEGPQESKCGSIQITGGHITRIMGCSSLSSEVQSGNIEINLSGFLVMPGLINAHDHLEFALFPRLADPPYRNYIDWGEDIHEKFPNVIAKHRAVPKDLRVSWGGIRNLLCGVTTVSHHNPLWPELRRKDFPVRVIQEYGWAHSLALGGDLRAARAATPEGRPFIVHACEGVDELAREELWGLDRSGLLDASAVIVHGLAIDTAGVELMRERGVSLIVCPSSNNFLFGELPDMELLGGLENVGLGNDSPLTAEGDLLDEIRFAMRSCGIGPRTAYRMVTEVPAAILHLKDGEGTITVSGVGDLIAVRDTGRDAADRLRTLSMTDIEFVMIEGRVQLASEMILERLPLRARQGLEPLCIDGTIRWLRAPVKELLRKTEEVLGASEVRLGSRRVRIPA